MAKILLIFILVITQASFAGDKVTCYTTSQKVNYLAGEPVYIKTKIINNTNELITYNTLYHAKYFLVKDQYGNKQKLNVNISSESTIYLFPNDSLVYLDEITFLFGRINITNETDHYGLSEGSYSIQFLMKKQGITIESNTLQINVNKPPAEEMQAFELYKKAWIESSSSQNAKADIEKSKSFFLLLVENYPQSRYASGALKFATDSEFTNKQSYNKKMLKEYPNSIETWFAINSIMLNYRSKKDKPGVENFLQSIISDYAETYAAKDARTRLEKIQKLNTEEWLKPNLVTKRRLKEYRGKQKKE